MRSDVLAMEGPDDAAGSQDIIAAANRLMARSGGRGRILFIGGLLAIMLSFLLLAIYFAQQSVYQAALAEKNRLEAVKWQREATAVKKTLADIQSAAQKQQWGQAQRLVTIANSEAGDLEKAAKQAVATAGTTVVTTPATTVPVTVGSTGQNVSHAQKVYIQFAGYQRETIAALNKSLRDAGWNAQGGTGERLGSAAGLNEVRFHGPDDRDAAQALASAVGKGLDKTVALKPVSIIVPGTLELWISQ